MRVPATTLRADRYSRGATHVAIGFATSLRPILAGCVLVLGLTLGPAMRAEGQGEPQIQYARKLALCIGINAYGEAGRRLGLADLRLAENDARDFADLLEGRYGFKADLLLSADATRQRIDAEIGARLAALQSDDVLIVYFSGHGITREFTIEREGGAVAQREGYLVPCDPAPVETSTREACAASYLSMRDLARRTRDAPGGRHVLLILDCCFSGFGGLPRGAAAPTEQEKAETQYRHLMANESRLAMTAGTEFQQACEPDGSRNGLFTTGLLAALNRFADERRPVAATELFLAMRAEVLTLADEIPWELDPMFRPLRSARGELVLIPSDAADWEQRITAAPPAFETTTESELEQDMANARAAGAKGGDHETDPRWQEEYETYSERAAAGDEKAMAMLHLLTRYGLGTRRDEDRAFVWAAESRDVTPEDDPVNDLASAFLAQCYAGGIGTKPNPDAAAALERHAGAQAIQLAATLAGGGDDADAANGLAALFGSIGASTTSADGSSSAADGGDGDEGGLSNPLDFFTGDADTPAGAFAKVAKVRADVDRRLVEVERKKSRWEDVLNDIRDWQEAIKRLEGLATGLANRAEIEAGCAALREAVGRLKTEVQKQKPKASRREFDATAVTMSELQAAVARAGDR